MRQAPSPPRERLPGGTSVSASIRTQSKGDPPGTTQTLHIHTLPPHAPGPLLTTQSSTGLTGVTVLLAEPQLCKLLPKASPPSEEGSNSTDMDKAPAAGET